MNYRIAFLDWDNRAKPVQAPLLEFLENNKFWLRKQSEEKVKI